MQLLAILFDWLQRQEPQDAADDNKLYCVNIKYYMNIIGLFITNNRLIDIIDINLRLYLHLFYRSCALSNAQLWLRVIFICKVLVHVHSEYIQRPLTRLWAGLQAYRPLTCSVRKPLANVASRSHCADDWLSTLTTTLWLGDCWTPRPTPPHSTPQILPFPAPLIRWFQSLPGRRLCLTVAVECCYNGTGSCHQIRYYRFRDR